MRRSIEKALRAAVVLICHAFLACGLVVLVWGIGALIRALNGGHDILIWGRLPLEYLFQAIDVGLICLFGGYGLHDAFEVLRR